MRVSYFIHPSLKTQSSGIGGGRVSASSWAMSRYEALCLLARIWKCSSMLFPKSLGSLKSTSGKMEPSLPHSLWFSRCCLVFSRSSSFLVSVACLTFDLLEAFLLNIRWWRFFESIWMLIAFILNWGDVSDVESIDAIDDECDSSGLPTLLSSFDKCFWTDVENGDDEVVDSCCHGSVFLNLAEG